MSVNREILGFLTARGNGKISCISFQLERDVPGKSSTCPCFSVRRRQTDGLESGVFFYTTATQVR